MDPEREHLQRVLDEAAEFVKTYRFQLTEDYLALIAEVENLPQNQSGADKSGRWLGSVAHARSLAARADPVPRKR